MTNTQFYIAIGLPILLNAVFFLLLKWYFDARFDTLEKSVNVRFDAVNARFDAIDQRFNDMRDLWRAELRRVEEVLDARLKHQEGKS